MGDGNQSLIIPEDVLQRQAQHPLLSRLQVTKAGVFVQTRDHFIERSGIPEAIMIYCQGGQGRLQLAGQLLQIVRGDLLAIAPGLPHAYGANPQDPWLIQWLHFRGDAVSSLLAECGLAPDSPILHLRDDRSDCQAAASARSVGPLLAQCREAIGAEFSLAHQLLAAASLQELFARLILYSRCGNESLNRNADIESAIAYMQAHFAEKLTLDQLAALCSLSKYHFIRQFKARTDLTPLAWLNQLRLRRACEQLETTRASIQEISQKLGFASPYYFSTAFRQATGLSPRTYRQRNSQLRRENEP